MMMGYTAVRDNKLVRNLLQKHHHVVSQPPPAPQAVDLQSPALEIDSTAAQDIGLLWLLLDNQTLMVSCGKHVV